MWGFVDCTRYYMTGDRPTVVLFQASLVVGTGEKVALLVRPGQGKSTIIRLLAGLDRPDAGTVLRDAGGWPLGYSGWFQADMTGEANVRSLAQVADVDPLDLAAFCHDFAELGDMFFRPLKLYSPTMKARLAMAASLGIPARTYLADDKIASGDEAFRRKTTDVLTERLGEGCGLIFVGSNPRQAKDVCERFYVVTEGEIVPCDDFDHAAALLAGSSDPDADEGAEVPIFDLA
jgi:capsular polysaccharide transport system ATP-binding protein